MVSDGSIACRIGVRSCPAPDLVELSSYFDHTLLKPDATFEQIDRLCAEAMQHRFACVCVNGMHVARCAEILAGSGVLVCSVVGFPLGAMATAGVGSQAPAPPSARHCVAWSGFSPG